MEAENRRELERWAESLMRSEVAELRAAGRAIRGLCNENEQLAKRLDKVERRSPDRAEEPAAEGEEADEPRPRRAAPELPWQRILIALALVVLIGAVVVIAARAAEPELAVTGPAQGAVVGRATLPELVVSAAATDAEWLLDGKRLEPRRQGERAVWQPEALADGPHELVVRRQGRLLGSASRTFRFTVDTKPPLLKLDAPATVRAGKPLDLRGTIEPGGELRHGARTVRADDKGAFRLVVSQSPARLVLAATDVAGNSSRWRVPVTVVPLRPVQPIRAVHVTAYAWADKDLRQRHPRRSSARRRSTRSSST